MKLKKYNYLNQRKIIPLPTIQSTQTPNYKLIGGITLMFLIISALGILNIIAIDNAKTEIIKAAMKDKTILYEIDTTTMTKAEIDKNLEYIKIEGLK